MNALFLSCLLSIVPVDGDIINRVDRIEINHLYNSGEWNAGSISIDQIVPYKGRYSIGFHILEPRDKDGSIEFKNEGLPENPVFRREGRVTWYKYNGKWRTIVRHKMDHYIYESLTEPYETWTIDDPELDNRLLNDQQQPIRTRLKIFP